jgi:hypothetical protein
MELSADRREVEILRSFALDVEIDAGVVLGPRRARDRTIEVSETRCALLPSAFITYSFVSAHAE